MIIEEEKIAKTLKIAFLFLITLLLMVIFGELTAITLLLFYLAFVKEHKR